MPKLTKADIFIAVNPIGSKFAKALQQGLKALNVVALRCSTQKAVQHKQKNRKVFYITQNVLDKIQQFNAFKTHEVSCPPFTTNPDEVGNLPGKDVMARTLINSTNGKGIVEFEKQSGVVPWAPLYTAYIPKKAEYRVHVMNGKVIDVQQKRKKRQFEGTRDTRVRNVANGYVYTRDNIVAPEDLQDLAINAVKACGYAYGACDIIYNEKQNKCFVLEVNSRPGLMGTTLENYAHAIKGML